MVPKTFWSVLLFQFSITLTFAQPDFNPGTPGYFVQNSDRYFVGGFTAGDPNSVAESYGPWGEFGNDVTGLPKGNPKYKEILNYEYSFGESTSQPNKRRFHYKYDSNGALVKIEYDPIDDPYEQMVDEPVKLQVNDSGRCIMLYIKTGLGRNGDGHEKFTFSYDYDSKGKLKKEMFVCEAKENDYNSEEDEPTVHTGGKTLFDYNDKGLLTWIRVYNSTESEDSKMEERLVDKKQLLYDNNNKLIYVNQVDEYSGKLYVFGSYTYSKDKMSYSHGTWLSQGEKSDFTFDTKGRIIVREDYWMLENSRYKFQSKKIYKYNEIGFLKEVNVFDKEKLIQTISYEY